MLLIDQTTEKIVVVGTGFIKRKTSHNISRIDYFSKSEILTSGEWLDWRESNDVTPVKDQGTCEDCWAFSAVAAVDGINSIKNRTTDLTLRTTPGYMTTAFSFIIQQNKKMSTEDAYQILPKDESYLMQVVSKQPVSVGIDGSWFEFKHYQGGVFNGDCTDKINHAVTVIGYGTDADSGSDYWLLKNSWGETWGENGYMRIIRDVNQQCGIALDASYPTM